MKAHMVWVGAILGMLIAPSAHAVSAKNSRLLAQLLERVEKAPPDKRIDLEAVKLWLSEVRLGARETVYGTVNMSRPRMQRTAREALAQGDVRKASSYKMIREVEGENAKKALRERHDKERQILERSLASQKLAEAGAPVDSATIIRGILFMPKHYPKMPNDFVSADNFKKFADTFPRLPPKVQKAMMAELDTIRRMTKLKPSGVPIGTVSVSGPGILVREETRIVAKYERMANLQRWTEAENGKFRPLSQIYGASPWAGVSNRSGAKGSGAAAAGAQGAGEVSTGMAR